MLARDRVLRIEMDARLILANTQAVKPWKMGGEVPQTKSTFLTRKPMMK